MIMHGNTAETAALVVAVRHELPRVTPATASAYRLKPADMLAWRSACDGSGAAPAQPASSAGEPGSPLPAPPDVRPGNRSAATDAPPGRPPNGTRHETRRAEHGTPNGSATATPGGPASDERDSRSGPAIPPTFAIGSLQDPRSALRTPQRAQALTTLATPLIDQLPPGLSPELRWIAVGAWS